MQIVMSVDLAASLNFMHVASTVELQLHKITGAVKLSKSEDCCRQVCEAVCCFKSVPTFHKYLLVEGRNYF